MLLALAARAGLVNGRFNLVNACYQNALVQALASAEALRRDLTRRPLLPMPTVWPAPDTPASSRRRRWPGAAANDPRSALFGLFQLDDANGAGTIEDEPGALAIAPAALETLDLPAPLLAQRRAVANRLQWLFARLAWSQRPAAGTWALKRAFAIPASAAAGTGEPDISALSTSFGGSRQQVSRRALARTLALPVVLALTLSHYLRRTCSSSRRS